MLRKIWTASLKSTLVLAMLLISTMVSFADDNTRFVPGTTVNSLGIGGLTVEEAKAQIEGFYDSSYQITVVMKGGKKEVIKGEEIGYHVAVPEGLQAILDAQNASGRNSGPAVDNSHRMEMKSVFDDGALTAKINALSCISGSDIVITQDAYISSYQEGQPFTVVPEIQGNNVDVGHVIAAVKNEVASGASEIKLEDIGCYYTVNITSEDENLKNLCNLMNQTKDMTITYTFGSRTEPLTGSTICTWLTGVNDGQITVSRDAVAAYVKGLADKYNTSNTVRTFQGSAGREVSVKGSYGWIINQAAEIDALIAMIRTGQSQSREPEYSQRGAAREGLDWGNTYVEVDMGVQHVYVVKDGVVVWDAPCVTGNMSKNYTTPEGIYSLYYKERDRVLRGPKKADGSYEYESPVSYWMPFNGGIGLHDANWRSKFGGSIYKTGGSHGCINLPPSKVPELYNLVYKGIPIICFY